MDLTLSTQRCKHVSGKTTRRPDVVVGPSEKHRKQSIQKNQFGERSLRLVNRLKGAVASFEHLRETLGWKKTLLFSFWSIYLCYALFVFVQALIRGTGSPV